MGSFDPNTPSIARVYDYILNGSQFIDLGCGLPTEPSTHDSVQPVNGDARVVYVDNDPVVVSHLSAPALPFPS